MSKAPVIKIILCFTLIIINGCMPALSAQSLPESNHPYTNGLNEGWPIVKSNATEMRLHFKFIDLNSNDILTLYDESGHELKSYNKVFSLEDHEKGWTEWYATNTVVVKLVTDSSGTDQGFKIDDIEIRTNKSLSDNPPESYHPYANNFYYKWPPIVRSNATEMRLHFKFIDLNSHDILTLYDGFGRKLKSYNSGFTLSYNKEDNWTEWYPTDRISVELITDNSETASGFKIDKVQSSNVEPNNVEPNNVEPNNVEPNNVEPNNTSTYTVLTSSANSSTFGHSVTLTAKVDTPSGETGEPSGTVTFMDGGKSIGTKELTPEGKATLTTLDLSSGSHSITAEYTGNGDFKSSKSSPFTLTVQEQARSKQSSSTEEEAPKIGQNVSTKDSNTEPSQTDNKTIWENPIIGIIIAIISGTITTVLGTIIADKVKK